MQSTTLNAEIARFHEGKGEEGHSISKKHFPEELNDLKLRLEYKNPQGITFYTLFEWSKKQKNKYKKRKPT